MPPIRPEKKSKNPRQQAPKAARAQAVSSSSSSSSSRVGPSLSYSDLKWQGVPMPAMSLASDQARPQSQLSKGKKRAIQEENLEDDTGDDGWDPFADLDEGADDFMGLQEVKGVGVRVEKTADGRAKRVGFYKAATPAALSPEPEASTSSQIQEASTIVEPKQPKEGKKNKKQKKAAAPPSALVDPTASTAEQIEDDVIAEAQASGAASSSSSVPEKSGAKVQNVAEKEEDGELPEGLFSAFADQDNAQLTGSDGLLNVEFDDAELPYWNKETLSRLHPLLKTALHRLSFHRPTPIQSSSLPLALPGLEGASTSSPRDVVGLAQTGSGKTLAYALPILQRILRSRSSIVQDDGEAPPLQALIILPTRELALQVYDVFQKLVAASIQDIPGVNGKKPAPWVRIAPVLGGMSEERQWRLLRGRHSREGDEATGKDAEIIIATVGRLWDITKSSDYLPSRLETAQTLVLDEADRLLEIGKFQELSSILSLLHETSRQTLMFSATLDPTLQVNLSKSRLKILKAMKKSQGAAAIQMATLIERVGFKDPEGPAVVDLTRQARVAEGLKEGKIECLEEEKDLYLYFFLLRYAGSSLVFLNSIDSVRRLHPLLSNLGIQSFALHGDMDQRSRLRSLDGFKKSLKSGSTSATKSTVLLATDVAARGLDVPLVSHVVHFHLPRSADVYIHRSGRTARAGSTGLSLVLLGPKEKGRWTALLKGLGRDVSSSSSPSSSDGNSIGELRLQGLYSPSLLAQLKTRLRLAKELDQLRHSDKKEKAEDDWMRKMADEAEIAIDDDEVDLDAPFSTTHGPGQGKSGGNKALAKNRGAIKAAEAELRQALSRDLLGAGIKRKYITQGVGMDLGLDEDKAASQQQQQQQQHQRNEQPSGKSKVNKKAKQTSTALPIATKSPSDTISNLLSSTTSNPESTSSSSSSSNGRPKASGAILGMPRSRAEDDLLSKSQVGKLSKKASLGRR